MLVSHLSIGFIVFMAIVVHFNSIFIMLVLYTALSCSSTVTRHDFRNAVSLKTVMAKLLMMRHIAAPWRVAGETDVSGVT